MRGGMVQIFISSSAKCYFQFGELKITVRLLRGANFYFQFGELLFSVHRTENNSSSIAWCRFLFSLANYYGLDFDVQFGELKMAVRLWPAAGA